jgi:hypothetical protein
VVNAGAFGSDGLPGSSNVDSRVLALLEHISDCLDRLVGFASSGSSSGVTSVPSHDISGVARSLRHDLSPYSGR